MNPFFRKRDRERNALYSGQDGSEESETESDSTKQADGTVRDKNSVRMCACPNPRIGDVLLCTVTKDTIGTITVQFCSNLHTRE